MQSAEDRTLWLQILVLLKMPHAGCICFLHDHGCHLLQGSISMQGDIVAAHAALTNPPDPLKPTRKRASTTLANPPPSAEIATSTKREPDAQQTLQSNLKKVHALKHLDGLRDRPGQDTNHVSSGINKTPDVTGENISRCWATQHL